MAADNAAERRAGVIRAYIASHFADAQVEMRRDDKDEGFVCDIKTGDGETYQMLVMDEALSGGDREMLAQLETYNPARVLREVIGFPVSVTASGCIV